MSKVALMYATGGMHPTGTGSYSYSCGFSLVVENVAYVKTVGIWGRKRASGTWKFYPAAYSRSVPGNMEIWGLSTSDTVEQFVVRYDADGNTSWDNNYGNDYFLDVTAGESTDGVGTAVLGTNVVNEGANIDGAGNMVVDVALKNLAYTKQVGIQYTTNGWLTWSTAIGSYQRGYSPSLPTQAQVETWEIKAAVGIGSHVMYAAFYVVNGATYWDNNFALNYAVL
jgi:hypothetical protein